MARNTEIEAASFDAIDFDNVDRTAQRVSFAAGRAAEVGYLFHAIFDGVKEDDE